MPRDRRPPPPPATPGDPPPFASRGGAKLDAALREFTLDVRTLRCADLGCSTGGFTDCLLRHGASHVIAVDTAYGQLAWKLRTDPRVETRERTNALHATPPDGGVDLVVADLSWTPQKLVVPVALRWLATNGRIITLIKPHYEHAALHPGERSRGVLPDDQAADVALTVLNAMPSLGARVLASMRSPLRGGRAGTSAQGAGNLEWLALLEPA